METTDATVGIYNFLDWLYINRKKVTIGVAVAAVIALGIGIGVWKKNQNQADANNMLFSVPSLLSLNPRETQAAPDVYLNISHEYPNTSAGELAQLLGAQTLFVDGKYSDAGREFAKFVNDHPESQLLPQAQVGVAAALEAQGKDSEAMQKYRDVVAMYSTDPSISSPAKLTLARLSEAANKPDQALSYYNDLARDTNPYDPWAAEARERRVLLLSAHPELDKQPTPPGAPSAAPQEPSFSAPSASRAPVAAPKAPATGSGAPNLLQIPSSTTNSPAQGKP